MAIKDDSSRPEAAPAQASPEPGSVSSPRDVGGDGPVTLEDRTRSGGQGSPDTNQAQAEAMPATPGHPDPSAALEPPALDEMNVGGADPQGPGHSAARDRDEPAVPGGPERRTAAGPGAAQRAPGSLGVSPEEQETDVQAGAAGMQRGGAPTAEPGNAQGVLVPHEEPAPGTSEQAPAAQGARSPQPPKA